DGLAACGGRERRRPPSRAARPRAAWREMCPVIERGGEAPCESVSQDGHRRQPGARALLPIREEEVAPASGAQPRVPDGLVPGPGADELVGVGAPEVEPPLPGSRRLEPRLGRLREGRSERSDDG